MVARPQIFAICADSLNCGRYSRVDGKLIAFEYLGDAGLGERHFRVLCALQGLDDHFQLRFHRVKVVETVTLAIFEFLPFLMRLSTHFLGGLLLDLPAERDRELVPKDDHEEHEADDADEDGAGGADRHKVGVLVVLRPWHAFVRLVLGRDQCEGLEISEETIEMSRGHILPC